MKPPLSIFPGFSKAIALAVLVGGSGLLVAGDQSAGTIQPVNLTPELGQVVKLHEAGMGEPVLKAFVENLKGLGAPTVDQILYLHKLGIADSVILVAIERGQRAPSAGSAPSASLATVVSSPPTAVYAPLAPAYAPPAYPYDYGYYGPYDYGYYPGYYYGGFYPGISIGFSYYGGGYYHGGYYHGGGHYGGGGIHVVGGHSGGGHH